MNDPRIAPVEDNLLAFYADALTAPVLEVADLDGARGYYTDIPFPLCNVVFDARFDPDRAGEQTRAVLDEYVARGLPWMWWATPSTTSAELELACAQAGMFREEVPGMHCTLDEPVDLRTPDGLEYRPVTTDDDAGLFTSVMLASFGMPDWLHEPLLGFFHGFDPSEFLNVVGWLDGRAVACGSTYLTGTTAGVYNIGTVPEARGRGIGYAVTAWLMEAARERGCSEAILHASAEGFPVYERLGYETVCHLAQMVWVPQE